MRQVSDSLALEAHQAACSTLARSLRIFLEEAQQAH